MELTAGFRLPCVGSQIRAASLGAARPPGSAWPRQRGVGGHASSVNGVLQISGASPRISWNSFSNTSVWSGRAFLTGGDTHHYTYEDGWQCFSGFSPWVGKVPWRRERLPTPVSWPGEFQGLHSPWGRKESDTTDRLPLSLPAFTKGPRPEGSLPSEEEAVCPRASGGSRLG